MENLACDTRFTFLYILTLLGLSLSGCGPGSAEVETIREDGVEVVLNHPEPYEIGGTPAHLELDEELRIDFEEDEFIRYGFRSLEYADGDSEGNLYVAERYGAQEYFVTKLGKDGRFLKQFGRLGEGPGELQGVQGFQINHKHEIRITDLSNNKIVDFDTDGGLIRETRFEIGYSVTPLANGCYVVLRSSQIGYELVVVDSKFDPIRTIDVFDLSEIRGAPKTTNTIPSFYWRTAGDRIYVGNEQRGYEILIFDLEGILLKKIRKEYQQVAYPEEFKEQTRRMIEQDPRFKILDFTPPFNSFFLDDENRLYVMTYEKGTSRGEFVHDIFDSDGIFIARKSIGLSGGLGRGLNPRWASAGNHRYYRLKPKENGFMELVVYRMIWR